MYGRSQDESAARFWGVLLFCGFWDMVRALFGLQWTFKGGTALGLG
jgi:hypothetical protein